MTDLLLSNYHPIFLTKSEVKQIFRITDRQMTDWTRAYGWKKVGHKFLVENIRETLEKLQGR